MTNAKIKNYFETQFILWHDALTTDEQAKQGICMDKSYLYELFNQCDTEYKFYYKVKDFYLYCISMIDTMKGE